MGTEEFWVPAVLAAVSAGGQYVNTQQANNREQSSEAQAIEDQQATREKGESQVNQTVSNIAKSNPNQIAAQATGDYVSQLRRNAAGSTQGGSTTNPNLFGASVSALPPSTVGSKQYQAGTKTAQNQVEQYGDTEAGEMADLDAAVRQRQNEGLEMQTLGTNLNTLGASSYAQNFVDQLRAQQAGQLNPWVSLFSSLAGNTARGMVTNPSAWGLTPNSTNSAALIPTSYTNPQGYQYTFGQSGNP